MNPSTTLFKVKNSIPPRGIGMCFIYPSSFWDEDHQVFLVFPVVNRDDEWVGSSDPPEPECAHSIFLNECDLN